MGDLFMIGLVAMVLVFIAALVIIVLALPTHGYERADQVPTTNTIIKLGGV